MTRMMGDLPVPILLYAAMAAVSTSAPAQDGGVAIPDLGDSPVAVQVAMFLTLLTYTVKLVIDVAMKLRNGKNGKGGEASKILTHLEEISSNVEAMREWTSPASREMRDSIRDTQSMVERLAKASGTVPVRRVDE